MTRNAWVNACAASGYIVVVVLIISYGPGILGAAGKPDTLFAPIAMISLLTLSVAFMAYAFFYQPLMLYVEGNLRGGISLFTKTLAIFAAITLAVLIAAFAAL